MSRIGWGIGWMEKQKIFLSCVTRQFKACRDALRSDLAAVGADVVVQEDFQQHGGTLLEKLEEYIASCDRIIALVGSAYGWQPEQDALPQNSPPRSYTQWEYYFARGERLNGAQAPAKPIYVYVAAPTYLQQNPVEQSDTETQRQQAFIEDIFATGKDRNEFASLDQLARLVLRDGFKLASVRSTIPQNLPYDSLGSLFKGRDDLLTDIKKALPAGAERGAPCGSKHVIHGLGGIGKTRLAVEYAWRYLPDYSACLFVTADSREGLARNLAGLCGALILNLPEQVAQEQELQMNAALRWLKAHPGWLLILDNVDTRGAADAVNQLLPSLQYGNVLITSRRTDWGDTVSPIPLDVLRESDAVEFLLDKTVARRTRTDSDTEDARRLANTLDGLALALEQAGAFINRKRISLSEYSHRWGQQEAKLRRFPVPNYPHPLAITWETSFVQLSAPAQALLNLMCWFAPDPIPREMFQAVFDADALTPLMGDEGAEYRIEPEPPDLEDLLDELESLSLLKWDSGNRSFSIHRLVQEITRVRLSDEVRVPALRAAVGLINVAIPAEPGPHDIRAWSVWDPLRSHVAQLVNAAEEASIGGPTARLISALGLYLYAKGLWTEAEPLMRRALKIDETSYGSEHPNVAIRLNNLAQLLQATNRLAEAEPLMRRALEIDETSYGSEHPEVAIDLNNLALLLQDTNRLAEAEPLMRRAVEVLLVFQRHTGHGHPNFRAVVRNYAYLLGEMGWTEDEQQAKIEALVGSYLAR